ncbi:sulfatase [Pedobacter psychrophilus]|uniref:Sulfatase n=1 Tax=Pedobacter psychrophilus TaxID=1826909 RepID=A0A179DGZ7_9SPHI|nr:sulfatase [Pedobacter psychrophilus]OAQ40347.1 sulfatase [Pedobacter psychrophilus]
MKKAGISFLTILTFSSVLVFAQQNQTEKPNILWITIEDTSPQFIGAYGNQNARTPNLDKLAKEGIRFTNAFSTGTVCSPSRSAIVTGVKTYKLGTGHHRSSVPIPDYIKGFPYYLQQQGYYTTNNKKTDYNLINERKFINEAWNESSGQAGWWKRKPGQPFFAVFNYTESHQSRTMTLPFEDYKKEIYDKLKPEERIGDNDFKMPPIYHDSPEMRKQFARVYNSIKYTDNEIGDLLARLEKDHLKDSTIIFFYADHGEGMPRGKTNGIDFGYRVPFIVWFPPMYKHLSPWGESGIVTDELIDFEDLAPTLITLAGGKVPDYLTGRVLIGKNRSKPVKQIFLSNDRSDNGPDLVRTITDGRFSYSRNFMAYQPELRFIRYMEIGEIKQQMRKDLAEGNLDSLQKSLFNPRNAEVLFDTKNDPWQTRNLALESQYQTMLKSFRSALGEHMVANQDVLLLPEYKTKLIAENSTPYEYRQFPGKYPVKEIYDAASLSGFRGLDIAKKQAALLNSPIEDVRYWAMLGLRCQNPDIQKQFKKEILAAIKDSYPPANITAASIAYDVFKLKEAEEYLNKVIQSENADLALIAINYLLYVKDAKPFIPALNKVREGKMEYNVKAASSDVLGSLGIIPNSFDHKFD